jgi:hypothetical protein
MMLPEGNGLHPGHPKLHGYVRFFNLDTGAFVRVHIPLYQDHCVLDSIDGLLVLQRDHDTAVRVLHPFTGDIVDLPPLSTLLPQSHLCGLTGLPMKRRLRFLRNISATATFAAGVVTVMLAFVRLHHVAVATPQDQQWTMSTWSCPGHALWPSQGKIYVSCATFGRPSVIQIFQIDTPRLPDELLQPPKLIATCNGVGQRYQAISIVECDSEILVMFYAYALSKMQVYKLADLVVGRYIPVTSIGDKTIFIKQRSISASAKAFPILNLKGDTIIYSHYFENESYLSEYHLSNDTRSPAMDHCSLDGVEPGPCSLIHHMITCCSRRHW